MHLHCEQTLRGVRRSAALQGVAPPFPYSCQAANNCKHTCHRRWRRQCTPFHRRGTFAAIASSRCSPQSCSFFFPARPLPNLVLPLRLLPRLRSPLSGSPAAAPSSASAHLIAMVLAPTLRWLPVPTSTAVRTNSAASLPFAPVSSSPAAEEAAGSGTLVSDAPMARTDGVCALYKRLLQLNRHGQQTIASSLIDMVKTQLAYNGTAWYLTASAVPPCFHLPQPPKICFTSATSNTRS